MSYLDTAWNGAKASYVADLGRYGKVGYSELAMHTQIAGKEVVRFALWPANDGIHVGWAHVETEDGRVTDGLPSEVLPGSVRSKLGYGNEMMPREARRKKNPWYHGTSRDGVREIFHVPPGVDPGAWNDQHANRWGSMTGPYQGQLEASMEAAEFAGDDQPMQVVSSEPGTMRITRPAGWPPPGEPTWPPRASNPPRLPEWIRRGRRGRRGNPWYHAWSHDEVPEVFHAKSDREAFYGGAKRYNQLCQMRGPFKTQKQAELDCGRMSSPFYQVMGGKGRVIQRPDKPPQIVEEFRTGRIKRREFHGLCNVDRAWPPTGSSEEIVTRRHNPSRRLSVPEDVQSDPKFQKELAAYRKRHGMEPVEVRRVKVPDGYPKYMSAWGKAPKVLYDSSNRSSNKGKRVHEFGEGGHDKPWLVSSEERGPKFLAYVGGDFEDRKSVV